MAAHDCIDEHLAAWCRERQADAIVDTLWTAGVPVGKVVQPHEQLDLEQLQHRGFFEELDHPVIGASPYASLPFRSTRGPDRFHRRHAPLLGEHNDELLLGLGLSRAEVDELEAAGIIGRSIPNA
jgi:crotonobetainyl-CoA:carnitine CoA-transferase CaiB-like acyl-CoA transferase